MRTRFNVVKLILLLISLGLAMPAVAAGWAMNMPEGVTPLSHDMYGLHMTAIYICMVIGVVVYGIMIYSIIYHRKSKGAKAASFHENLKLEITWAIIPFLILVALAIPATQVLQRMDDTANADVTVKIVGHQWRWEYQFLNLGISYYSNLSTPFEQIHNLQPKDKWYLLEVDKPLVLPVNQKIRFLVTSGDVIHSWWVPKLGVKRDAIPGFIHEAWAIIEKPGVYRGQCAELCGVNHGYMPIVVKAVTTEEFNAWVASENKVEDESAVRQNVPEAQAINMTMSELMHLGKQQYEKLCVVCHKIDGTGNPPVYPALKGSSVAVGKPISRHINKVLKGVPNTAMQAFGSQLTDKDIAAIVTYERNAWGNNTGDIIQPAQVAQIRQGNIVEPTIKSKSTATTPAGRK